MLRNKDRVAAILFSDGENRLYLDAKQAPATFDEEIVRLAITEGMRGGDTNRGRFHHKGQFPEFSPTFWILFEFKVFCGWEGAVATPGSVVGHARVIHLT